MRHRNHRHQLGVKKEHREALVATLAAALFLHGRIRTTLAKARALRPFAEKIITLAKRAAATDDVARKLHYRRLAIARVRDKDAVKQLFDERVTEFTDRQGGYTRIYKTGTRIGDAAEMALIELIDASDEGYPKQRSKGGKAAPRKAKAAAASEAEATEATTEGAEEAPEADEATPEATEQPKKVAKKAVKKAAKKAASKPKEEATEEEQKD